MRFGFIGAGNMAGAIVKGMMASGKYNGRDILLTSKTVVSAKKLAEACGVQACETVQEVIAQSDVLVLAVKPHVLPALLPTLQKEIAAKAPLVVSIAAGRTLPELAELLPEQTPIVRVMPNINAAIGASTSGLCANALVTAEQKALVRRMFETIGTVAEVAEEQFSIFTVLGGSAPAFAYLYMDALARAGVKAGMSKQQALQIVAETVLGSAKMVLESEDAPWTLIDRVCSPGGTTIEG
ncbi:MAG: pyrroline-5-carboxylate reductase, partial [Anaerotignum sp.]|nr:pyrroline-5-carboxylate reductase [Anaerotignum sp.]